MAKKAATPTVSINLDEEVKKALVTIAAANGPMRFVGKGDQPPTVFAKNDAKTKRIVEKCLDAGNPLAVVVGSGQKQKVEFTAPGVMLVLGDIPEDKAVALVGIAAEKQTLEDRKLFFRQVAEKLPLPDSMVQELIDKPIEEMKRADEIAKEAKLKEIEVEKRRRQTQDRLLESDRKYAEVIDSGRQHERAVLLARCEALGVRIADDGKTETDSGCTKLPPPANDDEKDFRRLYARRLVSAWHQAVKQGNKDGQRFLEAALYNIDGIHAIGEPGKTVQFDPTMHEPEKGADVGATITITHCGWWLQEEHAKYIILRATAE